MPDFSVDACRDQLGELHDRTESDDAFVAHTQRLLIEAHRPHRRQSEPEISRGCGRGNDRG